MVLISCNLLNVRPPTTSSPRHGSNVRPGSVSTNLHTPPTVNQLNHISLSTEEPNSAALFLRQARSKKFTVEETKQLHCYVAKLGFDSNIYLINSLLHVYAVNGDLDCARKLFDKMVQRDVVSWTTLVDGYGKFGKMYEAQELFDLMPERNIISWNVLISGYGKNGDVEMAQKIFDGMTERDIVSWSSLISTYARNGLVYEAFTVFRDALTEEFITPTKVTLLSVLPAIAVSGCAFWGKCIHAFIIKMGFEVDGVLSSALIDMYTKCDCLDMAFEVFESCKSRGNVASWNPMLAGLVRQNQFEEALDLFQKLQLENVEPNRVTLVSILPVFAAVEEKTVELWNAMITGLGLHGRGKEAIGLFSQMKAQKFEFNDITFTAVLNACSHSGLVDEGLNFFAVMKYEYKMTPKIQHYGCMVDLLGRAGRLEEAKDLICNKMPIKPDIFIWKSLLGACKTHGNVEIGEFAAKHLMELHPSDSSSYVLMSNIYEATGRSNEAISTRKKMIDGGVKKEPGFSLIESKGVTHKFLVADKSHSMAEEIYIMLDEMVSKSKSIGYAPNKKLVLFDIADEEKESAIFHHSEKLAAAFGLIDSEHGAPLCIVKNLRMCSDCHVFFKLVSKIYDREIVVRDHNRFHHFANGKCSCMDYW